MKEQDLIDLGFERVEDSDDLWDEPFHFYTYDFTNNFSLISATNFEAENYFEGNWFVEIFDDYYIRFYSKEDVKTFIDLINRNKI
jgi:hypothetical protein